MKTMIQLINIISVFLVYIALPVSSYEICESYSAFGEQNKQENCSSYCCGSCTKRYCCSDLNWRLDQKACVAENCTAYYDWSGYYYQPINCNLYGIQFCCGSCESRYCCSYTNSKLNQSSCPGGVPKTMIGTTTANYWWLTSTKWSWTTTYYYFNYETETSTVVAFTISFFMAMLIIVVLALIAIRKIWKKSGQQRYAANNIAYIGQPTNQSTNPQSSAFVVANNTAYNYDMNKIYNTNLNDDLPPSYDSLNPQPQPKKTDETVVENLPE